MGYQDYPLLIEYSHILYLSFLHVKANDDDCIKEKCLVCKQFVDVMKMRTHWEVCKEAKRIEQEEMEKEYVLCMFHGSKHNE